MVLQSIRDRLTGILAVFILGILVIPFAFVGVSQYFTASGENLVARVNDIDITYGEFNQSFSEYRRRMQSMMGAAFDPLEFDTLVARREHLDRMIDEKLMRGVAEAAGLEVDDDLLAARIRQLPAFQVDGMFNPDVYQSRLQSQGLTPRQFEADLRADSIVQQLPMGILTSSIATPREVQELATLQEQTRSFTAVMVPAGDPTALPAPAENAIEAYHAQHPERFRSEEMVAIEYLELSAVDVTDVTEPDEEFLRTRFEQQQGRFISPEQRLASHILIAVSANADDASRETARQEAMDLAERARGGEDFASLAREFSDDLGSSQMGGDLGWIEPGVMTEAFEQALYELSPDRAISKPVQTGFGWHVIQLREIQPASGMDFEEARAILLQEHHEEEAEREFLERADRLVDLIYEDPTTLTSAALDLGLEIREAGPFSRSEGQGIAANPDVVDAAFSDLVLLQGSVSDPVDLGENHIVMIRLKEHLPAAVQPVESVRDQIEQLIREQESLAVAREQAETLHRAWQEAPGDLDRLAADAGLQAHHFEAASRGSADPDERVVRGVFGLPAPAPAHPVTAVLEADDGYAVVGLEGLTPGHLDLDSPLQAQQYRRQIANAAATIEALAFMRQLREAARIEVFEDRL